MKLGRICAVTMVVPDLAAIEQAYTELLGCRVVARGAVPRATARVWGAPAVSGCRFMVLVPETGEETSLRFIEDPLAGEARAFVTHGWNATEITVQDTDALAATLAGSAFRIIGPPRNLSGFEWIRAMQVLGPAGECLYLTDVGGDDSLAPARCMVGQVFIAVVGGADIGALAGFYRSRFGNAVSGPVAIPICVINDANGLDAEQRHELALVDLPGGTRVELDQYPATTVPRAVMPGRMAPGMSMVSFLVDEFPSGEFLAPSGPGLFASPEWEESVCLIGPAGERIELCLRAAGSVP